MLRLRPYKSCDGEAVVSWIKDETAFYKWSAGRLKHYPVTADELNAYYDSFAYRDDFFVMAAFDETGITGQLFMRFLDEEKKLLRFGFIIVDDSKRGRGYGREMLKLAAQYAFGILKVERITLGVFENNKSAYLCYKSAGFQDTGQWESYDILNESWKCLELALEPVGRDVLWECI